MEVESTRASGSATVQGELWGDRAKDWAEVQEGVTRPLYEAVLSKVEVGPGISLLDIGCGSGIFCELAAESGARVAGLDASAELIAIAQKRVPRADFSAGEMEQLPYADGSFDIVTGFNSFQYAAKPVNALKEAHRVARAGAPVVAATWGNPEDCEAAAYLAALGALVPPPLPGPFALSGNGALEALVAEAGLTPTEADEVDVPWVYADLQTALKGLMSAGPAVKAIQTSGGDRVREAIVEAIAPFKVASGGYRLENKFRYLIAKA